jgi:hypothetical protein
MTGPPSILDTPVEALSDNPINRVLTAIPTLTDSRWATAQPFANSNSTSANAWPAPEDYHPTIFAMNRGASEAARPALSEAGTGVVSTFSNRENTMPADSSSNWPVSLNAFPPRDPSQSDRFPGLDYRQPHSLVFDKSKATPEELMQHRMRGGMPPGYVPPHFRNVPPHLLVGPTPTYSFENLEPTPTQPATQPKKEEKKVAYLKDSIWAS